MSHRRALVVINRKGSGGEKQLEAGVRILEAADIEPAVFFSRRPEQIPRIILDHSGSFDLIVVGGGDGTLSRAAPSVLQSGLPLGILPMGNANDLARTLGIPNTVKDACNIIAQGHRRRIDLGHVNGKPFFNVASLGISAKVADQLNGSIKRRWGLLSYVSCAWSALHSASHFEARVICDDHCENIRSMQIAVGNGRHYGGGMTIVDNAEIDDGRLDLYSLSPQKWWRLVLLLPILRRGTVRQANNIHVLHGQAISIHTDRPMPINVDGEIVTRTPADFQVIPAALEVFAPEL